MRRSFLLSAAKILLWCVGMLATSLVSLVLLAPLMLAFALVVDLRLLLGFLLGIVYPPLGRAVLPGENLGDGGRFDGLVDIAFAPMSWWDDVIGDL